MYDSDKQTKTRKFMLLCNTPHGVHFGTDIGDLSKYNVVWGFGSMPK